ncbi:FIG00732574: hypothetical protein [Klebsiella pneumoniae IS43]|uniref:Uncharacterized protein n=1 Tax=Klebsiella pneumoniae IS43 TaxID=1432552 RepID=W1DEW8_KLEPN|nr:FIG00732574: hypothetical protein [Klebsiella pneumoniae IS43]
MFDRLFSRSRQKISKKFFPPASPAILTAAYGRRKKSAPARIFTISSAKNVP